MTASERTAHRLTRDAWNRAEERERPVPCQHLGCRRPTFANDARCSDDHRETA